MECKIQKHKHRIMASLACLTVIRCSASMAGHPFSDLRVSQAEEESQSCISETENGNRKRRPCTTQRLNVGQEAGQKRNMGTRIVDWEGE